MNRSRYVADIAAIVLLMGAACACNNPSSKSKPVEPEEMDRAEIHGMAETHPGKSDLRDTYKKGTSQAQIYGNIMKSDDGKVIGILFSTPSGDVCEMREGYSDAAVSRENRHLKSSETP